MPLKATLMGAELWSWGNLCLLSLGCVCLSVCVCVGVCVHQPPSSMSLHQSALLGLRRHSQAFHAGPNWMGQQGIAVWQKILHEMLCSALLPNSPAQFPVPAQPRTPEDLDAARRLGRCLGDSLSPAQTGSCSVWSQLEPLIRKLFLAAGSLGERAGLASPPCSGWAGTFPSRHHL